MDKICSLRCHRCKSQSAAISLSMVLFSSLHHSMYADASACLPLWAEHHILTHVRQAEHLNTTCNFRLHPIASTATLHPFLYCTSKRGEVCLGRDVFRDVFAAIE